MREQEDWDFDEDNSPDEQWNQRRPNLECTQTKPLLMVFPPHGVTIQCPVHPEGHFISGSPGVYL